MFNLVRTCHCHSAICLKLLFLFDRSLAMPNYVWLSGWKRGGGWGGWALRPPPLEKDFQVSFFLPRQHFHLLHALYVVVVTTQKIHLSHPHHHCCCCCCCAVLERTSIMRIRDATTVSTVPPKRRVIFIYYITTNAAIFLFPFRCLSPPLAFFGEWGQFSTVLICIMYVYVVTMWMYCCGIGIGSYG